MGWTNGVQFLDAVQHPTRFHVLGESGVGVEVTTRSHLQPGLTIRWTPKPFPNATSWRGD